ncbi:MAG: TonB-dependent receptor, partial [Gammaproteobacteria bacterium]|nr:TonB-dependent receptor [Gammaproteobacteria bacterium]
VTARKREELLQRAPLSISTFSRNELASRKLADISQVAGFTPNLEFDFTAPISGSTNNASAFIRGVGQTDYVPNKDPGVGIYLDGVYITRTVGSVLNLQDIERVEVLRGPQGTLYGKNTIGGAINVFTAKPGDSFESELELTVGSDDRTDFRGFVNAPITETLAGRWSLGIFKRDGHMQRLIVGDRLGSQDQVVGRMALSWSPSGTFEGFFSVDYSTADEQSTAARLLSTDIRVPTSQFSIGDAQTIFAGQAYNVLIGASGPGASTAFEFLPPLPASAVPYDRRWITDSPLTTNSTGPNYSEHDVLGVNATLEWPGAPVSVKSISAYRTTDAQFGRDPDGSPLVIGETEVWVDHRQFSQEIQLSGAALQERLNWIGGLYYLDERGRQRDFVPFADETFRTYGAMGIPIPNFLLANGPDSSNTIESFAAYGEASLALSDAIDLTAGLRRTFEERETVANSTQGGMQSVVNPRASMDLHDTSGRLILSYRPTDSLMSYLSYANGFKSGGFNHRFAIPPPQFSRLESPTRFAPERVDTIELGFKTSFANGRARVSAAIFSSDYRDVQVLVFDLGIPRTINAAAARIDGLEFESALVATDWQRFDLAYGYLDARYTRLDIDIPGAFGNPISIVPLTLDSQFVNTPRHSVAVGSLTEFAPGRNGQLQLRIDARFRSEVANDAVNTPELVQDDLWLVSASIDWLPTWCSCQLALFGENLTDETYFVSGAADSPGSG